MATTVDIFCGICHARHSNKTADYWCQEYDEGLCSECQQSNHGVSKGTRNHDVIDIANYKKLPSSVLGITNHCIEHNMKYQNYCPKHETLTCPVCISSNHKECTYLLALPELIKTSKSSTLLESMEHSLKDLQTNIENIIQDRQQNLSRLREERLQINAEIKRVRDKINSHLDTLEQKIISDLLAAEEKSTLKIEKLLEHLKNEKKTFDDLDSTTLALKNYASDMQTFFGSKEINKEVENEEKNVKLLIEDGSLEQVTLECSIDDKISDMLSSITTFGSVSIESSPPSVQIKVGRGKQAQILSIIQQPALKSIQDIKLTLISTINIPNVIRGSIVLQNGKMIFAESSNKRLLIMNGNGTLDKEILCSSCPNDIAMIDDKDVAVSTNDGIYIINIGTEHTKRLIKTRKRCDGITFNNDTLLWCEQGKGLQMSHLSGHNVTTLLQQSQLPDSSYVTTYEDNVYQTNYRSKSLTCFTTNGDKMWEFRDESLLTAPIGVTVDNGKNVYITTYNSNSVVVLTPDGKQSKIPQSD